MAKTKGSGMAEALFRALFVTVFVVGLTSLIKGEFEGWPAVIGWFLGTFVAVLAFKRLWPTKSR